VRSITNSCSRSAWPLGAVAVMCMLNILFYRKGLNSAFAYSVALTARTSRRRRRACHGQVGAFLDMEGLEARIAGYRHKSVEDGAACEREFGGREAFMPVPWERANILNKENLGLRVRVNTPSTQCTGSASLWEIGQALEAGWN